MITREYDAFVIFAAMITELVHIVVIKPVQLLVSHTLDALRTIAHSVCMLFSRTTSGESARMYTNVISLNPAIVFCVLYVTVNDSRCSTFLCSSAFLFQSSSHFAAEVVLI